MTKKQALEKFAAMTAHRLEDCRAKVTKCKGMNGRFFYELGVVAGPITGAILWDGCGDSWESALDMSAHDHNLSWRA